MIEQSRHPFGSKQFGKLSDFLCVSAGVLVLGAALLVTADVLARNVFRAPLGWPFDVIRYLFLFSVFMATPAALLTNSHIRVTLLIEKLPGSIYRSVTILGFGVSWVYLGVLIWGSWSSFASAFSQSWQSMMSYAPIPLTYLYGAMVIGSFLLIIATYFRLRDDLKESTEKR